MAHFSHSGRLKKSDNGNLVVALKVDTFGMNKSFSRVKHMLENLESLRWASRGWRRSLIPFVRFHYWWTKPV